MSLSYFDYEILDSNVARAVLACFTNNVEDPRVEDVERHLHIELTEGMRLVLPQLMAKWREHFLRKKKEYVPKSNRISWMHDRTYELFDIRADAITAESPVAPIAQRIQLKPVARSD